MSAPRHSTQNSTARLWLAELSLLSVAVIWGVNIPLMKIALALGIDRFALNGLRLVISAVTLLVFAALEYRRGIRPDVRHNWMGILGYATLVSVLYQMLFLLSVSQTTSADIALIMATVPMWTAIGARVLLTEILTGRAWLGLIIGFTGTVVVTLQGTQPAAAPRPTVSVSTAAAAVADDSSQSPDSDRRGSRTPANSAAPAQNSGNPAPTGWRSLFVGRFGGNLLALAAAFMWAGGTIFSRPMLKRISPLQLSAFSASIGLPFHLAVAWPVLPAGIRLLSNLQLDACLIYSGVLSTGLALPMWSFGVKHAGAAHATMFQNLSPIVAIVSAWLMLGEPLNPAQAVGGALILGGLLIMRSGRK
jgi:drug/metabolite transporter (DMT)-like permease